MACLFFLVPDVRPTEGGCKRKCIRHYREGALERGPLVFCFGGIENGESFDDVSFSDKTVFYERFQPGLPGGVLTLKEKNHVNEIEDSIPAIPYLECYNCGACKMKVWLDRE